MYKPEYKLKTVVFRKDHPDEDKEAGTILQFLQKLKPNEETKFASPRCNTLNSDRVVQYHFSTTIPPSQAILNKDGVAELATILNADVFILKSPTQIHQLKLAVFDMDSTLIQQEVIDLLAGEAGVESQVAEITARAMNGELDFSGSLKERVALLKNIPETVFADLKPRLTLTKGADVLLRVLREMGIKTALLSGGFMPLATFIGHKLGIDFVYANELEVSNGKLTGRLAEGSMIVNAEKKQELLLSISKAAYVENRTEVLAVGDGANDLLMLGEAGIGVAFNAKPRVQAMAPFKLNSTSLVDILHVLGLTSHDVDALSSSGLSH